MFLALLLQGCTPAPTSEGGFLSLTCNVAGLPEGISSSHPGRSPDACHGPLVWVGEDLPLLV